MISEAERGLETDDGRVHRSLRHDLTTIETEDSYDTERCTACGKVARLLAPERCPAKEIPGYHEAHIEARTIRAADRDRTLTEFEFGTEEGELAPTEGLAARTDRCAPRVARYPLR